MIDKHKNRRERAVYGYTRWNNTQAQFGPIYCRRRRVWLFFVAGGGHTTHQLDPAWVRQRDTIRAERRLLRSAHKEGGQ